ncbi:MAG: hypothetical protein IJB29_00530 [Mailhella sp.]|nr:hypothetical protein [Mailhella sp.]
MNDLNMIHAQEADLRSRVAASGLACDSPSRAPSSRDVDAFRAAMQEDRQEHGGTSQPDSGSFHEKQPCAPGENPQASLSSLFSMVGMFSEVEGMASAGPVHAAGLSAEELDRLVERILVSAEDGRQEVRLTLSDRILPGTEIILSRTPEGMLSVSLHCTDSSSFQTLVASQFDLKKRLEAHEMTAVEVSVDIQQEDGNADRRSRGYFALDPDEARKTDDA